MYILNTFIDQRFDVYLIYAMLPIFLTTELITFSLPYHVIIYKIHTVIYIMGAR